MELIAIILGASSLFLAGANAMIFCVIKFNDLKHMEETLQRIEKNQSMIWEKLDKTTERLSCLEGKVSLIENKE